MDKNVVNIDFYTFSAFFKVIEMFKDNFNPKDNLEVNRIPFIIYIPQVSSELTIILFVSFVDASHDFLFSYSLHLETK